MRSEAVLQEMEKVKCNWASIDRGGDRPYPIGQLHIVEIFSSSLALQSRFFAAISTLCNSKPSILKEFFSCARARDQKPLNLLSRAQMKQ